MSSPRTIGVIADLSSNLLGRATRVYEAYNVEDPDSGVVIKDSWVDVKCRLSILSNLHHDHIELIRLGKQLIVFKLTLRKSNLNEIKPIPNHFNPKAVCSNARSYVGLLTFRQSD